MEGSKNGVHRVGGWSQGEFDRAGDCLGPSEVGFPSSFFHCSRWEGNDLQPPAVGSRLRLEVRGLPGLKIQTWGTQSWWSDVGHPRHQAFLVG